MAIEISNEEFLVKIGERLKHLRIKAGLSYRELAQRCDVDYSYISKIEKGKHNIQLSTLLEVAKGLEIHPKLLLEFDL